MFSNSLGNMSHRTACKLEGIYQGRQHRFDPKSSERAGDVAELPSSLRVHFASSNCREQNKERQVMAAVFPKEPQPSQGSQERRLGDRGRGSPGRIHLQQKTDTQHPQGSIALVWACSGSKKVLNYQPLTLDKILEDCRGSWPNMI